MAWVNHHLSDDLQYLLDLLKWPLKITIYNKQISTNVGYSNCSWNSAVIVHTLILFWPVRIQLFRSPWFPCQAPHFKWWISIDVFCLFFLETLNPMLIKTRLSLKCFSFLLQTPDITLKYISKSMIKEQLKVIS